LTNPVHIVRAYLRKESAIPGHADRAFHHKKKHINILSLSCNDFAIRKAHGTDHGYKCIDMFGRDIMKEGQLRQLCNELLLTLAFGDPKIRYAGCGLSQETTMGVDELIEYDKEDTS